MPSEPGSSGLDRRWSGGTDGRRVDISISIDRIVNEISADSVRTREEAERALAAATAGGIEDELEVILTRRLQAAGFGDGRRP